MNKHFRFKNSSGISRPIVILLVVCFAIMSLVAGYFISISANALNASGDPVIRDEVRPGSVRTLQQARGVNQ
ncbi:MAG: hypothetical protein Q8L21_02440 [Candidatus Komeilibacteria bacterium]|nr:hypothetical protein [Candidatus Komeilibacteria bacterium]